MPKFINFTKIATTSTLAILMAGTLNTSSVRSNNEEVVDATEVSGVITPNTYNEEMGLNGTVSLERSIVVNIEDIVETITTTTPVNKLDVLFLADNTGSMSAGINNMKSNANSLLTALDDTYGDVQVGVARYYGDPQEVTDWDYVDTGRLNTFSKTYTYTGNSKTCKKRSKRYTCYKYNYSKTKNGVTLTGWRDSGTTYVDARTAREYGNSHVVTWESAIYEWEPSAYVGATGAYQLQEAVNGGTKGNAIAAINNWSARGGDDWAEANFFALHQAATSGGATSTGFSSGLNTNWRSDAKKIIVWFGDAKSHTNTVNQAEAIQALTAQNITVVAIHTTTTETSLTQGLNADSQASSITTATGGQFASIYSSELASTIQTLIGTAAIETTTTTISPTIDLVFANEGETTGLNILYTCTDALGCDNVKNNESRTFKMEITGNSIGTYNFKTIVNDVDGAEADNNIKVLAVD